MTRSGRRPVVVVVLVLAALAAAIGLGAAAQASRPGPDTARRHLDVRPIGPSATDDWTLGGRALLVTERGRTRVLVELTRISDAAKAPALVADFDGSGGGDAREVACSASDRSWAVEVGAMQTIVLDCDAVVAPTVVEQQRYLYAGAR